MFTMKFVVQFFSCLLIIFKINGILYEHKRFCYLSADQLLFMGLVQIKGKTFKAARKLPRLPVTNNNLSSPIKAQCQKKHRPMRAEHLQQSYENTHLEIEASQRDILNVCVFTLTAVARKVQTVQLINNIRTTC